MRGISLPRSGRRLRRASLKTGGREGRGGLVSRERRESPRSPADRLPLSPSLVSASLEEEGTDLLKLGGRDFAHLEGVVVWGEVRVEDGREREEKREREGGEKGTMQVDRLYDLPQGPHPPTPPLTFLGPAGFHQPAARPFTLRLLPHQGLSASRKTPVPLHTRSLEGLSAGARPLVWLLRSCPSACPAAGHQALSTPPPPSTTPTRPRTAL